MTNATTRGGQPGNTNATKNKIWSEAIRKAIIQRKDLEKLADALINRALEGDISALKEIGDRLEGKPVQAVEQKTEHSGAVTFTWLES